MKNLDLFWVLISPFWNSHFSPFTFKWCWSRCWRIWRTCWCECRSGEEIKMSCRRVGLRETYGTNGMMEVCMKTWRRTSRPNWCLVRDKVLALVGEIHAIMWENLRLSVFSVLLRELASKRITFTMARKARNLKEGLWWLDVQIIKSSWTLLIVSEVHLSSCYFLLLQRFGNVWVRGYSFQY